MATPYPIPASVPFPHVGPDARASANRSVATWLFVCCALVLMFDKEVVVSRRVT